MQRNLELLEKKHFDLLVIGGGINGAWIALDATQRGMHVALIEKGDFGAATSAATGRMVHGGIRYLQHLSFGRLRRSLHERMLLLKNAPHLVHPLRFLIPTSGHGMKGKEILSLAMFAYDLFAAKAVPNSPYATIHGHARCTRNETLHLEPLLSPEGVTGSVCFTDCQMPYPERLTLAVVKSADAHGAVVANYAKAREIILKNKTVAGCLMEDMLTGEERTIKAKCVVNAAGPWMRELTKSIVPSSIRSTRQEKPGQPRILSKGIHIITRSLTNGHGLALATRHQHAGSWLNRGGRHFFIVPWEGLSLVGTTNVPFHGELDDPLVFEEDILGLIADVNSVYPAAGLRREDVRYFYGGLYPDDPSEGQGYQGGRKDVITDHDQSDGVGGLLSVTGVKYTTSRHLAERVVNLAVRKLKRETLPCRTAGTVLHGGDIPGYDAFKEQVKESLAGVMRAEDAIRLVRHYGSKTRAVLKESDSKSPCRPMNHGALTVAQVRYGVLHEMARKLSDVLFRRTDVGLRGCPTDEILWSLARVMAQELGWDEQRIKQEIVTVKTTYRTS